MGLRYGFTLGITAVALASPAFAQGGPAAQPTRTAVNLHPDLLPASFGAWHTTGDTAATSPEPTFSLANANRAALEEDAPLRSAVQNYTTGQAGKTLHVEAVEFKDASGALAAFSMLSQSGMHEVKDLGSAAKEGDGGVLLLSGAIVAVAFPASLAESPAKLADVPTLKALIEVLPKPLGSQALQPLLPTLVPSRGLVPGSLRYAMGQHSYMADGGVLPAAGLGWDKDAEAVTAKYADKRGSETLTLLLYPTPTIAAAHLRSIDALLSGMGPSFAHAKTRREGSLLVIANGTFSADAAQALTENTHLRQIASTDKAMPTPEIVETRQTFGLLANIILFSGLLGAAAIFLGLFLGGGRALLRIIQGKPAATETEFLSLHLEPQNPTPVWSTGETGE